MKRLAIHVHGKVQGVFFRKHTEAAALGARLTGFVQNEEDGSVYIEAEGNASDLEEFVAWCRRGPERARVADVKVSEIPVSGGNSFRILR